MVGPAIGDLQEKVSWVSAGPPRAVSLPLSLSPSLVIVTHMFDGTGQLPVLTNLLLGSTWLGLTELGMTLCIFQAPSLCGGGRQRCLT